MNQTDFPELENKEIHYFVPKGIHYFVPHNCRAIVVYAHYDIGITIIKKVDKKHKLFCLNKKEVSNARRILELLNNPIKVTKGTVYENARFSIDAKHNNVLYNVLYRAV